MKLSHPELDFCIECEENQAAVLVIENQDFLSKLVESLIFQLETGEGGFVLSAEDGILSIDKNLFLITDLFNLDFNSKKIVSKIYSDLSHDAIDEKSYPTTCAMLSDIEQYVANLIDESDVNLTYDIPQVTSLFKLFNVHVSCDYSSFAERIIDYLTLINQSFGISCFVLLNLHSYVSRTGVEELYKFAFYKKYSIISVESHISEPRNEEKVYTIDSDLCSIV